MHFIVFISSNSVWSLFPVYSVRWSTPFYTFLQNTLCYLWNDFISHFVVTYAINYKNDIIWFRLSKYFTTIFLQEPLTVFHYIVLRLIYFALRDEQFCFVIVRSSDKTISLFFLYTFIKSDALHLYTIKKGKKKNDKMKTNTIH